MIDGGIYAYVVPLGRSIAGFTLAIMLGIVGGWIAIVFNAMIEFPWSPEVHRTIYFWGIGIGAGTGAYLAWMNLTMGWRMSLITMALVFVGAIIGTYVGYWYGHYSDASFLGRGYTIENSIHMGAPIGAIIMATILGVINEIKTLGR